MLRVAGVFVLRFARGEAEQKHYWCAETTFAARYGSLLCILCIHVHLFNVLLDVLFSLSLSSLSFSCLQHTIPNTLKSLQL